MNSAISSGVSQINSDRNAACTAQAAGLIDQVLEERASNQSRQERIEEHRKAAAAIAHQEVTAERLFGPAGLPQTGNTASILEVVAHMNKERQDSIKAHAAMVSRDILSLQDAIAASEKRIAELLEKLQALDAHAVTEAQVLGQ